jgi:hypothetical protein
MLRCGAVDFIHEQTHAVIKGFNDAPAEVRLFGLREIRRLLRELGEEMRERATGGDIHINGVAMVVLLLIREQGLRLADLGIPNNHGDLLELHGEGTDGPDPGGEGGLDKGDLAAARARIVHLKEMFNLRDDGIQLGRVLAGEDLAERGAVGEPDEPGGFIQAQIVLE